MEQTAHSPSKVVKTCEPSKNHSIFQKIIGFKLSSLYSNQGGKGIPYNRETQMEKKYWNFVEVEAYLHIRTYVF